MPVKCPTCHSKDNLIEEKDLNLFVCHYCNHTFTLLANFNKKDYNDHYFFEEHKNWFKNPDYHLFEFIYKKLVNIYKKKSFRLFDVGCGRGEFLKYMLRKNISCEPWGVDLSDINFKGIKFINANFLSLDLAEKFDVVVCLHVIEHVEDPILFIKKIGNVLKEGGFLFIATVDNESLIYRIARFLNCIGIRKAYRRLYYDHHLQHFSYFSLKKLLDLGGYRELERQDYNYSWKSLDIHGENFFKNKFYFFSVLFIFSLSSIFRCRIAQLILAQKR